LATIQLHDPAAVRCFDDGRAVQSLTPAQLQVVNRGEGVVATVDLPNHRWPRVCVFQFIAGSPETSLAVLVDYPLRPSYLPDVRVSRVVPATTDSVVKRVAYVVHVLLRVNETDTLRETVRALDSSTSGSYQLEWGGLTSTMAQSIRGSATFVPWHNESSGATGTLMIYDQTVEPGSRLAGLPFIKKRGIEAVRNTAAAIARQVETEVAQQPRRLETQVAELRRTLRRERLDRARRLAAVHSRTRTIGYVHEQVL
jgi:hypothetical protein